MIEKGEEPRSSAVKMKIRAKKQTAKEKNGGISRKIKDLQRDVAALLKQKFVKNVVQDLTSGGHEWMRAKWSAPIRKYWKISEQMIAASASHELKTPAAAIAQYQSALSGIEDGVQVGKRSSYEEDQIFFSMPNNPQSEVFQTVLYDGNSYRNFGPYNTKAELYAALEQYTNDQTKSGNMTEVEANSILDKYR